MTLIIEESDQLEFYTNLFEIVEPFREKFAALKWTLSNQEYIVLDYEEKGIIDKLNHNDPIIEFDGLELLKIIESRQIQFVWGVFCGFKNSVPKFDEDQIPFADGNSNIWEKPDNFITDQSEIEIICFDSSLVIVKFKEKFDEEKFLIKFREAKKLNKNAS